MSRNTKNFALAIFLSLTKIIVDVIVGVALYKVFRKALYKLFLLFVGVFIMLCFAFHSILSFIFIPSPTYVPEVKYAEFPFEITYSVDGKLFQKSDVLICECREDFDPEFGKRLIFIERFKGDDKNVLCVSDRKDVLLDCGNAEYYLLSEKPQDAYAPGEYIYRYGHKYTLKEAKERFKIEIISTKFSEPINNKMIFNPINMIKILVVISLIVYGVVLGFRYKCHKRFSDRQRRRIIQSRRSSKFSQIRN